MDDQNAPATRGDLADFRTEFKQDVEILRSEMNHQYRDVVERMDDLKTERLKGFYAYATGNNKRVTEIEGNQAAFISRLGTLEDRMLECERRLNIPPQA
jgi:hypothetical protein